MRNLEYLENVRRGTAEFPVELYSVSEDKEYYRMPCHWHPEYEIIAVKSGRLALMLDEERIDAEAGDIVLLPEGTLHSGEPNACVYYCIVFSTDFLIKNPFSAELRGLLCHRPTERLIRAGDSPELSRVTDSLLGYLMRSPHTVSRETEESARGGRAVNAETLICYGLLLELFGVLAAEGRYSAEPSAANRHVRQLKSVLSLIETQYQREITLSELADAAGLSPKYLCRVFASLTGRTPMEYLNEYRLESACALLANTERGLLDVAYSCGFNDQSYFIKLFKRYKGVTPGEYRRRSPYFSRT